MGNYGEVLFTQTWYDSLIEEIKQHYIADASRSGHFFWHIYTRMNWRKPWYAGFRESQTEYRLRNQKYFQRNFMPGMLARSAAFDAGYAFVADYKSLEANGHTEKKEKQPMNFIFTSLGGLSKDFTLEFDNFMTIELPITLQTGQTLKYSGGDRAIIYSKNWQQIKEIEIETNAFTMSKGKHSLTFNCKFEEGKDVHVKLELRFMGTAEAVKGI